MLNISVVFYSCIGRLKCAIFITFFALFFRSFNSYMATLVATNCPAGLLICLPGFTIWGQSQMHLLDFDADSRSVFKFYKILSSSNFKRVRGCLRRQAKAVCSSYEGPLVDCECDSDPSFDQFSVSGNQYSFFWIL